MTDLEWQEAQASYMDIQKVLEALQYSQLMGNSTFAVIPHEHPGIKKMYDTAKTGYGFTLYLDYYKKGNQGARIVVIDKDFNAKRPGITCYEHVQLYPYLHALEHILQHLHKTFNLTRVPGIIQKMKADHKAFQQKQTPTIIRP